MRPRRPRRRHPGAPFAVPIVTATRVDYADRSAFDDGPGRNAEALAAPRRRVGAGPPGSWRESRRWRRSEHPWSPSSMVRDGPQRVNEETRAAIRRRPSTRTGRRVPHSSGVEYPRPEGKWVRRRPGRRPAAGGRDPRGAACSPRSEPWRTGGGLDRAGRSNGGPRRGVHRSRSIRPPTFASSPGIAPVGRFLESRGWRSGSASTAWPCDDDARRAAGGAAAGAGSTAASGSIAARSEERRVRAAGVRRAPERHRGRTAAAGSPRRPGRLSRRDGARWPATGLEGAADTGEGRLARRTRAPWTG